MSGASISSDGVYSFFYFLLSDMNLGRFRLWFEVDERKWMKVKADKT